MKTIVRFAFILCCLFLQGRLVANTVIVKGYVKDSANHVVANKTVKIYSTDSTNNGCLLSHTTVTNANGYYLDTLSCNGIIRSLAIIVESCNGYKIIQNPLLSTNNIVESNFIICSIISTPPLYCKAAFSYASNPNGIKFNGAGSSTISGDSIVSRTWTFGDSSGSLIGNIVDPVHAYSKPGIYTACLKIKTKKGCESSYCQTVVFTPASNDCQVQLLVSVEKIANKKFRFNSSLSSTVVGDSILQRIWKFSDGSSLDGNQISPTKEFKVSGNYSICLRIRTAKGCEKEYCVSLSVRDSLPGIVPNTPICKAFFNYSIKDSTIQFNSAGSTATLPDDSIISRTWYYMDNATSVSLSGNVIDPSYIYSKPGTYNVYLVIKTKKGCESKFSALVTINRPPVPTNCKAQFTFTIQGKSVKFNSANTAAGTVDSIISRNWLFGDKTELTGNHVDPTHQYSLPGNYIACLYIKTKSGCESKICLDLTIKDSVTQPTLNNCKAFFTYSIKDSTIKFNSAGSTATSNDDSIISRNWYYMDNATSVSLSGNVIDPSYVYSKPGTYNVYLVIKTKKGCESKFSALVTINRPPVPTNCKAQFTFTIQGKSVKFNSNNTSTVTGDSIVSRNWLFGDKTELTGNQVDPTHQYSLPGNYIACLYIKTKSGCESKICLDLTIKDSVTQPTLNNCKAFFTYSIKDSTIKFNSAGSTATSNDDSIISRNWYYMDNTTSVSLSGNVIDPSYIYSKPGTYNVYLVIKTKKGCESKFSAPIVITGPTITTTCKAQFTFTIQNKIVKFTSIHSTAGNAQDSIISRNWYFGDSSTNVQSISIDPFHNYAKSGKYTVILSIKTKNGCESKFIAYVVIETVNCPVEVVFNSERVTLKKVQFNSSLSKAQIGDSIIQRNWKFGDNTILSGNEIKPVKEFPLLGVYNTCLQVRTLNGCEAQVCKQTVVQDTITLVPGAADFIKILSINPNPVITRMVTTIFSRNTNVESEISVYDIYGTRKLGLKKLLVAGNNIIEINTEFLQHGPYFLKVSTKSGIDTKAFYKL